MSQDDRGSLELSSFIRETLVRIVEGVEEARDAVDQTQTNAEICPTGLRFERGRSPGPFKPGRGFVQEVEFDVAVTVSKRQGGEATGKGEVNIGVPMLQWLGAAKGGGDIALERQRERSTISRVKFTVPVLLPSEVYPWGEENKRQRSRKVAGKKGIRNPDC